MRDLSWAVARRDPVAIWRGRAGEVVVALVAGTCTMGRGMLAADVMGAPAMPGRGLEQGKESLSAISSAWRCAPRVGNERFFSVGQISASASQPRLLRAFALDVHAPTGSDSSGLSFRFPSGRPAISSGRRRARRMIPCSSPRSRGGRHALAPATVPRSSRVLLDLRGGWRRGPLPPHLSHAPRLWASSRRGARFACPSARQPLKRRRAFRQLTRLPLRAAMP